jgi:hypothetical protein
MVGRRVSLFWGGYKLGLDQVVNGCSPRPEVVYTVLAWRWLAHGTTVERRPAFAVATEPDRQLANLPVRKAVDNVEVARSKVEANDLRPFRVSGRARKELEAKQRAFGLAPQE